MDKNEKLEQLKEKTQRTDKAKGGKATEQGDITDDIVDALEDIDSGEENKTVAYRDEKLASLFIALRENPEMMESMGEDLFNYLDISSQEDVDRSMLHRLLVRVGLKEAVPEIDDQLADANIEYNKSSL